MGSNGTLALFSYRVRKGLCEEVTFVQKPEGSGGDNGNSEEEDPEAQTSLVPLRDI